MAPAPANDARIGPSAAGSRPLVPSVVAGSAGGPLGPRLADPGRLWQPVPLRTSRDERRRLLWRCGLTSVVLLAALWGVGLLWGAGRVESGLHHSVSCVIARSGAAGYAVTVDGLDVHVAGPRDAIVEQLVATIGHLPGVRSVTFVEAPADFDELYPQGC